MSSSAQKIVDAYGVTLELADRIVAAAQSVQADPGLLADLINYETAGTFSPSIKNPNSTATGLIQFLSSTASKLGTSTAALAEMSAIEQMDYVQLYLERVAATYGPLSVESDLYMSVFYPAAIGKGTSYAFGSAVTAVNASNTVQDYVDAVRRKSKLGAVLSSSSSSSSLPLGLGLAFLILGAIAVS